MVCILKFTKGLIPYKPLVEVWYWLSAHYLMMLCICTMFCESISKDFRVTDLNSRVNTRVVTNVDARWMDIQTHARRENWLSAHPLNLMMLYICT